MNIWKLADRNLRQIIVEQPAIGLKLSHNFGSLIAQMQDYLVQRLAKTPELSNLPRHTLQAVADQLEPRRLAKGQYLFRAGDNPSGLFLVESGSIDVQAEGTDERQVVQRRRTAGRHGADHQQAAHEQCRGVGGDHALGAFDRRLSGHQQPPARPAPQPWPQRALAPEPQRPEAAAMRLRAMPIFEDLPPQTMQAIVARMVLQHVPAGERVYRIGEAGDALYLIESGEIELTAENAVGVVEEIGRIGAGSHFGEQSLLTGQIRTEDATATRNSNLWVLYKADLDALGTQYPAIGTALSQGVALRLASGDGSDDAKLQQFALFAGMNPSDLRQVAAYLHPMRYRAGEQIFRAGAPAEGLYLIERGTVSVQALGGAAWQAGPG